MGIFHKDEWKHPQPRFSTGSSLEYATFHLAYDNH